MKQILLATVLIALPVGVFSAYQHYYGVGSAEAAVSGLGDLSPLQTIVSDVQSIAATGDLAGAAKRATDLETAWDDDEAAMRPLDPEQWGTLDGLIDDTLHALRAGSPDAGKVDAALVALSAGLSNPGASAAGGTLQTVAGVAVSDAGGHALPCETMIDAVRARLSAAPVSDAIKTTVADLQEKSLERCNADDDKNADAFSAQALSVLGQ